MKLTNAMIYYFMFWTFYIPVAVVLSLLLNRTLEQFFAGTGIGALILLVFLTTRLAYLKIKSHTPMLKDASSNSSLKENPCALLFSNKKKEVKDEKNSSDSRSPTPFNVACSICRQG